MQNTPVRYSGQAAALRHQGIVGPAVGELPKAVSSAQRLGCPVMVAAVTWQRARKYKSPSCPRKPSVTLLTMTRVPARLANDDVRSPATAPRRPGTAPPAEQLDGVGRAGLACCAAPRPAPAVCRPACTASRGSAGPSGPVSVAYTNQRPGPGQADRAPERTGSRPTAARGGSAQRWATSPAPATPRAGRRRGRQSSPPAPAAMAPRATDRSTARARAPPPATAARPSRAQPRRPPAPRRTGSDEGIKKLWRPRWCAARRPSKSRRSPPTPPANATSPATSGSPRARAACPEHHRS